MSFFVCVSAMCSWRSELTRKYGAELQAAYEDYTKAVMLAYETGDTSQLQDTTTGYKLRHHLETIRTKAAETVLEWLKIEVIRVTVREYSATTAEIVVEQKHIGDISVITKQDRRSVWVVKFQRVDGKWKVSNIYPYFTS
jgi:hypothetical protein